jgi:hypothetical protein
MSRPRAITQLALIQGLLGISAAGGVLWLPFGQPLPVAPQLLRADPKMASWLISIFALAYLGTTLIAAAALWRMRPWARVAYLWFVASIVGYMALFCFLIRIPSPLGIEVIFFGFLGGALYLGWRVVGRTFPAHHGAL